jgi:hypothetical protein
MNKIFEADKMCSLFNRSVRRYVRSCVSAVILISKALALLLTRHSQRRYAEQIHFGQQFRICTGFSPSAFGRETTLPHFSQNLPEKLKVFTFTIEDFHVYDTHLVGCILLLLYFCKAVRTSNLGVSTSHPLRKSYSNYNLTPFLHN